MKTMHVFFFLGGGQLFSIYDVITLFQRIILPHSCNFQ